MSQCRKATKVYFSSSHFMTKLSPICFLLHFAAQNKLCIQFCLHILDHLFVYYLIYFNHLFAQELLWILNSALHLIDQGWRTSNYSQDLVWRTIRCGLQTSSVIFYQWLEIIGYLQPCNVLHGTDLFFAHSIGLSSVFYAWWENVKIGEIICSPVLCTDTIPKLKIVLWTKKDSLFLC